MIEQKTQIPPLRLIAWEVTRACNLACKHCRAEACENPDENELTTAEAKQLISSFPETGKPIIIFTGGDPMMRADIYELLAYAKSLGLVCAFSPNGTLITEKNAKKFERRFYRLRIPPHSGYNSREGPTARLVSARR